MRNFTFLFTCEMRKENIFLLHAKRKIEKNLFSFHMREEN